METAVDHVAGVEVERAVFAAPVAFFDADVLQRQIEIVNRPCLAFQARVDEIETLEGDRRQSGKALHEFRQRQRGLQAHAAQPQAIHPPAAVVGAAGHAGQVALRQIGAEVVQQQLALLLLPCTNTFEAGMPFSVIEPALN